MCQGTWPLAEWLEELKQYRAIGTPEECLRNKDFLRFLANSMNQKKYETYLGIYNAVEKDGRDEEWVSPSCITKRKALSQEAPDSALKLKLVFVFYSGAKYTKYQKKE